MSERSLSGERVRLRLATHADVPALVAIRETPEVHERWLGADLDADCRDAITRDDIEYLVIEDGSGKVIGGIQWEEEDDPQYRHAGIDIFLDPAVHGQGLGSDAVRTLTRFLIEERGHHRLTIDPAADNVAAIRCYAKVGFKEIGVMRQYEMGADGAWHDGLLMELLAEEFADRLTPQP